MIKVILKLALCSVFALYLPSLTRAETRVALELVLAVDSSTSVSKEEFKLQYSGYVKAFKDPEVVAAIRALGTAGIAVTYMKWSSHHQHVQSVDWIHVFDEKSARTFANAIMENSARIAGSGTAIGDAVMFSVELFKNNGFNGDRKAIDVSADGRYNAGSAPSLARGIAVKNQITINGLAIDDTGDLARYFEEDVIGGDGAFVITANSYEDFASAIKRKLLRELAGQPNLASFQSDIQAR